MKFVWLFLGFLCISSIVLAAPSNHDDATVTDEEWEDYKKTFEKSYPTKKEESYRRDVYAKNLCKENEFLKNASESERKEIRRHLDLNSSELIDIVFADLHGTE